MITVKEQFDKVYADYRRPQTEFACSVLENQCYRDAVEKLDPEDREVIKKIQTQLVDRKPTIRNFGDSAALELLAKLGMFYNGIKAS